MQVDISQISDFLKRFAPNALDDVLARHPESAGYFGRRGLPLGEGPSVEPVMIDAAVAMLDSIDNVASDAISKTIAKLKSTRKLEMAGSLLGLLASGGVIGAILGFDDKLAAAVLGVVGFAANAIPLLTTWLRGPASGQGSIDQLFVKLRDLSWDARALRAKFSRAKVGPDFNDLIQQANNLGRQIYVVLSDLGYHADFRPV